MDSVSRESYFIIKHLELVVFSYILAEMEKSTLTILKDSLEEAQKNTSHMLSRLKKFDNRLKIIDEKMRPIQQTTEKYSRTKENINLTLIEIEKTYEYFRIAGESKEIILSGLHVNTNFKEFFDALGKLSLAKRFFEEHKEIKSSSTVLTGINGLLKVSCYVHCGAASELTLLT